MIDSIRFDPSYSNSYITLHALGRIHFGLWEISESQPNCYGGIGLMIKHSSALINARVSSSSMNQNCEIKADDYWLPRIESLTNEWLSSHSQLPVSMIDVHQSPTPHRGLGSGTQMACAIASLLFLDQSALSLFQRNRLDKDTSHVPISQLLPRSANSTHTQMVDDQIKMLAKLGKRGTRSNIGLFGFLAGGFIIDQGRSIQGESDASTQPRTRRVEFPDWPVIAIHDDSSTGDSGMVETEMFDRCSRVPNPNRQAMMDLVNHEILPAIQFEDWKRFDKAIGQYGRFAGQIFAPAQGGVYRSEKIAHTIEVANKLGIKGATQSSWGPTVVAIATDVDQAHWFEKNLKKRLPHLNIEIAMAANHSAQAWVP